MSLRDALKSSPQNEPIRCCEMKETKTGKRRRSTSQTAEPLLRPRSRAGPVRASQVSPGPGSALWEQPWVVALAESSLAGMALVPAGERRHARKSPPRHKGRGHAQAGSQQEFWEFSASLRKAQEYAGVNMKSTVTYFLLTGSSSFPNPTR